MCFKNRKKIRLIKTHDVEINQKMKRIQKQASYLTPHKGWVSKVLDDSSQEQL